MKQITELIQKTASVRNYTNEEKKCPVCNGTGFESYFQAEKIYGGAMIEFVKKCSRCSGILRNEDLTRVPPEFRDVDIEKFNFESYSVNIEKIKKLAMSVVNDFKKWETAGKGLYLWSKTPGSGKTFLSCSMAKSIMIKYDLQMRFVTAQDYISAIGDSYKRDRGEIDDSEIYRNCSLLVMDDIGTQQGKEWQQQELFRLINKRLSDGNITFYTANMPPEKLNLEDRAIDRIIKTCVVVQMPEESIRAKKAKSEQEIFLKEIAGV